MLVCLHYSLLFAIEGLFVVLQSKLIIGDAGSSCLYPLKLKLRESPRCTCRKERRLL